MSDELKASNFTIHYQIASAIFVFIFFAWCFVLYLVRVFHPLFFGDRGTILLTIFHIRLSSHNFSWICDSSSQREHGFFLCITFFTIDQTLEISSTVKSSPNRLAEYDEVKWCANKASSLHGLVSFYPLSISPSKVLGLCVSK